MKKRKKMHWFYQEILFPQVLPEEFYWLIILGAFLKITEYKKGVRTNK